jgi:osmotically-inducible protein OsmY
MATKSGIRADSPGGTAKTLERSDEDLAQAVRSVLESEAPLPGERIKPMVCDGVVLLEGTVETQAQRTDAERAVHRLPGVRNVIDQVEVAERPAIDAGRITRDIEEVLERQAQREARRINVSVHDGTVTLTGSVRSWSERNAIRRTVELLPAVRAVENRITVDPYLSV